MEVHHHSHTERKKWTHYFWEFLMLFLAVFCGFIAENFREHTVEKKKAKEYARSLIVDLQKDTSFANYIKYVIQINSKNIDTLVSIAEGKSIKNLDNLDLAIVSANIGRYPPFIWNRATLDQIKSSGSLRYFSNDSIVARISAYDALTRHLDGDFISDEARVEAISEKRAAVFDLNYPREFRMKLFNGATLQSVRNTDDYRKAIALNRMLLTKDINQVKNFINLALIQQPNFYMRGEVELPRIIEKATELIQLIKKEYQFQ